MEGDREGAFFGAIREGDEEMILRLLDAHPGLLESEDSDGDKPLEAAVQQGQLGLVRLLVQRGADIHATGYQGGTALHLAAGGGHDAIIAFLISHGAPASIRDEGQMTPLMIASVLGHLGVVQMLLEHTEGQALNNTSVEGMTALHYAVESSHEEVVDLLLSNGARANIRDGSGLTPLDYASLNGHLRVTKMLMRHMGGQGLNERNNMGSTVLHYAAGCRHEEIVKALLLAGADPSIRDNGGMTPRAVAEEEVSVDLFERDAALASLVEDFRAGRARCVAVFEWWDGELERRYVLCKATCLHKAYTTQRDMPTSQVPTYLEARVAAGHAVPDVEVVLPQSEEQQQEQEEKEAVVEYVMQGLNEELLIELLEGFYSTTILEGDQEEYHSGDEDGV